MFIVRLAVLVLWALYAWNMGQIPPSGLNAFGKFVALSFFFVAPALYLLPTFEAWLRRHRNISSIALVNILLGWTLIGWVVAEAWALKRAEPVTVEPAPVTSNAESGAHRECPYAIRKRKTVGWTSCSCCDKAGRLQAALTKGTR